MAEKVAGKSPALGGSPTGEICEGMETLLHEYSDLKESLRLERNKNADNDSEMCGFGVKPKRLVFVLQ